MEEKGYWCATGWDILVPICSEECNIGEIFREKNISEVSCGLILQ